MLKLIITTALIVASLQSFACTSDGQEGILPENNMWISPNAKSVSSIDETRFNAIIDKVEKIYSPIISNLGATLSVVRNWNSGTVNAFAQRDGDTWIVSMFGGLARHEAITEDGFALVVCHEVGHHIGGAPKKIDWIGRTRWATNEGQADYFATLKCLRKVFRSEDNEAILAKMDVPAEVISSCAEQFSDATDQLICQRGAMAGMSTAKLFQDLRGQDTAPDFTTPDTEEVSSTSHSHPATQCRLDTYFAGATCAIDENIDVDERDEATGVCYRASGDTKGVRPLCWFKPEEA